MLPFYWIKTAFTNHKLILKYSSEIHFNSLNVQCTIIMKYSLDYNLKEDAEVAILIISNCKLYSPISLEK